MRLTLIFLLTIFLALPGQLRAQAGVNARETRKAIRLSAKEQAELRKGMTVVRLHGDETPLFGGLGVRATKVPAWRLWRAITDYPEYPKFFPRNIEATILSDEGTNLMLRTVLMGSAKFHIRNESLVEHDTADPALLLMRWTAQKSTLEKNFGFWLIEKRKTDVLFYYQTNFGGLRMTKPFVQPHVQRTIEANMKAMIERAADERYDAAPESIRFAWR